ncbi:hypothetical protein ACFVUN_36075 [Kitasatospora griseola]
MNRATAVRRCSRTVPAVAQQRLTPGPRGEDDVEGPVGQILNG